MMHRNCGQSAANRLSRGSAYLLSKVQDCQTHAISFSKNDFGKISWLLLVTMLFTVYAAATRVSAQAVTGYTLINADTDQSISALNNNSTVNLASVPTGNLNICANLTGTFASVKLTLKNGAGATLSTTQNVTPYCFDPNSETDIGVMTPALAPGVYTVTATSYSGTRGTGTAGTPLTISFYVVNETGAPTPPTHPATDEDAARFLARASFGATEADIARLKQIGYAAWIDEQLTQTPKSCFDFLNPIVTADSARAVNSDGSPAYDRYRKYDAQHCVWREAATGSAQLRQRMTLALSEIFVISTQNNQIGDNMPRSAVTYLDILNRNAFGSYRQLLEEVTLSPAMGTYLSHRQNRKENLTTGREPDENYAREIMQLFSIGLFQLNQNGTRKLNSNGQPIPTYTLDDIKGLARVFTGLTWADDNRTSFNYTKGRPDNPAAINQPMKFTLSEHSISEKKFLGVTIPAKTAPDGVGELNIALNTIANHPSVGPFIAERLIQLFVTSNPSRGYVSRVAAAFNNDGTGVRGNLGRVIKAVLLDREALNSANLDNPRWGKVRQSTLRKANLMRLFKYRTNTNKVLFYSDSTQGADYQQNVPLHAPSVFNFYRPGFAPPGSALETANLVAPELQILNESTLTAWGTWVHDRLQRSSVLGSSTEIGNNPEAVFDYAAFTPLANDTPALVGKFETLLGTELSAANKQRIIEAVNKVTSPSTNPDQIRLNKVKLAAFLVMVTPEYLVQK